MKKLLPLLLILMSGTAAHASMSTRHQTSLQLSVDAARTITSRTANSYSVSGSGVTLDVGGGGSADNLACLLYTSPSPRDQRGDRMPSSA